MNMFLVVSATLLAATCAAQSGEAERIFRAPRPMRGNTGIMPIQPIDQASWIAHPDDADLKRPAPQRNRAPSTPARNEIGR